MKFDEAIALLKTTTEDTPLPEDFADKLESAYLSDLDIRDTKVQQLESKLTSETAAKDAEILRLKTENYDLGRKLPNNVATPPKPGEGDKDQEKPVTIESLAEAWKY